ncbi:ATP-binding protein [Oceanospirillum sediminis]|uniref:C4-dicarboxylate transport sensor protein DctB n=1 Tax=Oceanospirillum sediminis TaxID=2760088 RepID=A0A839IQW7_9GAMM|nr:ATP-binding protein [Oceanospirillum sediminis]MBB1487100.1 sensor histidine kinase [Oceanospirillum sediminis]
MSLTSYPDVRSSDSSAHKKTATIAPRILAIVIYLILSLVITWQTITFARTWTLQNLHQQGSDELLQVITQIREAMSEYRYLPFLISQNKDARDLLAMPFFDIRDEVSLYLEQINLVAGSSAAFVLNADGQPLAYSHWREEQDFFLRSHNNQAYYQQARDGHRGRQFSLNSGHQNPAYFLSSPIYDGKRFIGAAVVRIETDQMMRQIRSPDTLVLSDEAGNVFFSTGPFKRFQPLQQQMQQSSISLSDGIFAQLWKQGKEQWLERSVVLDDITWRVTVLQSTQVVKRNVRNAFLFSVGGFLALGLAALLLRERRLKLRSQHETRLALARSESQKKAIINNAQVGLLLVNPQARVTFANEMALQQFGISVPLIMDKEVTGLLAANEITPVHRVLSRLEHKGFSPLIGYESSGLRADGSEFPIMISIRRMQYSQERLYLVTVIDISRRKKLELELYQANLSLAEANSSLEKANEFLEYKVQERTRALETAQEELVQAEKLVALGRMSSAVVHELNQPLTAIRNYVAICRQILRQPDMLADSLDVIDDLTQRMAQITTQLKTFAYKKPQQSQPVPLPMAIDQALLLFRQRLIDDNIHMQVSQPEETLYIQGDSARLEQVLVNLIRNALDALSTVSSHSDEATQEPEVSLTVTASSDKVQLIVLDNGPGIAPELLPQLFDPFVTSKTIGHGLGLGLAIVRSILQDLGGSIQAENRATLEGEKTGASFTVTLPRTCPH